MSDPIVVMFGRDTTDEVLVHMADLRAAGRGWINITPSHVDPAPPPGLWSRINARSSIAPRITWTAPQIDRPRPAPVELGIEHPMGRKALDQLADAGHALPPGWVRTQDHAMRGIVVVPAPSATDADVLLWALDAVEAMVGPPAEGRWRAQVYPGT